MRKILLIVIAVSFLFACQKDNLERSVEVYNTGEKISGSSDDSGGSDNTGDNGGSDSGQGTDYVRFDSPCESEFVKTINKLRGLNNDPSILSFSYLAKSNFYIMLKDDVTGSALYFEFYDKIPTESCMLESSGSMEPYNSTKVMVLLQEKYYSSDLGYYTTSNYYLGWNEDVYLNVTDTEIEIAFCDAYFYKSNTNTIYYRSSKFKVDKSLLSK